MIAAPPITQAQSGLTFHVARGGDLTLRLSERWAWTDPRVSSRAVTLTPVEYFRDPGFREWRVVGRVAGRATITSTGTPARRFVVTIVVAR